MNIKQSDFESELRNLLDNARKNGEKYLEINSGNLHKKIGGYPSNNHRMPQCCKAMKIMMRENDCIIESPPKGNGATLTIRYYL